MTELSRRSLFRTAVAGAAVACGVVLPGDPAAASVQSYWRYCGNCHVMFYDGYAQKGVCAAGGGHVASGYYFTLPYDVPATDNDAQKGVCPSGSGHYAQGYRFTLPHEVQETPSQQSEWRYCRKCHVMFYDGYEQKGRCPSGGGHWAQGYMFVLPHV